MMQSAGKIRSRRRRQHKIPKVWGLIVWTCEVVCEYCVLKWGSEGTEINVLRAQSLWSVWLFL
uniref:Uncharacterized protein n=1 Tax=Anguilla anguilla TaxID=7936 RepID=A0A0E9Q6A2_ANGAN